jgi:photosystem II stability/assembly factor-like uncharacterized protein
MVQKKRVLVFLLGVFQTSFLFPQSYGWVDRSENLPPFPFDTTIINQGQDTLIANLSDVFFLDDLEGWLATSHPFADSAAVLHTLDGGDNWEVQMAPEPITAIEMLDADTGYAAAFSGSIFKTVDGGANWDYFAPTFALALTDMTFPPGSDTGYVCGMNGAVFRVSSTGIELLPSGVVSDMKSIHFINPDQGWMCGQSVLKEYRNGQWMAGHAYPSGTLNDVFFTDSLNGWVAGTFISFPIDTVGLIHTQNDSSWATQPLSIGNTGDMLDVFFLNPQLGWAAGTAGKLYSTGDGGQNWEAVSPQLRQELLRRIQFTSPANGYVVGNKKTLLKYTLLTGVEEPREEMPSFTVFPNPSDGVFKIHWEGGTESMAIRLTDLRGEVMYENESQFRELLLSANHLPAGIYFLSLGEGNRMATKKILISRR